MKRNNSDNDNRSFGNKRYKSDTYNDAIAEGKFELRVLIPTKAAGAIIGKGGEYIKSVRDKFDATLTVPDKSTPERVLTILCRQESVIDCFSELLVKLADFKDQKRGDMEVRILVHQSHAGAIIGRGGSKIKELREQTGTQMKVFQDCCPNSTDRVVLIAAAQEKIPDAVRTLVDFIREIPIKGIQKQYDTINYDPRMAFGYGGYEFDRRFNGVGPMAGRGMGGSRGPPSGMMPPPFEPFQRGVPPGSAVNYGTAGYGRGMGPQPMGGGMPPHGAGLPPMDAGPVTSTQVTIPNELGGTIIGKGGERINRIRHDSGARIEVGQSYGAEERIITITGTPSQIQAAQYMLQQRFF